MKPDVYLSGEKSEYLSYKVPKNFEYFFKEKDLFLVLIIVIIALTIAELVM